MVLVNGKSIVYMYTHDDNIVTHIIEFARQTMLKPYSEHRILVISTATGLNTVDAGPVQETSQLIPAAHAIVNLLPSQLLNITTSTFFSNEAYLPKYICGTVCYRTNHTSDCLRIHSPSSLLLENLSRVDQSTTSNVHCTTRKTNSFTDHGEVEQASGKTTNEMHTIVAAVH